MTEKLEEKILKYFEPVELVMLDNGYNLRGFYNAVTVPYIYEWVLNKEYSINNVVDKLLELHTNKKLSSLFCNTVENVVFHNSVAGYWNYSIKNSYEQYSPKYAYKYLLNYLEELKINDEIKK